MIEMLQRKSMQVDEVTSDVHPEQLPTAFVIIEIPAHHHIDQHCAVADRLTSSSHGGACGNGLGRVESLLECAAFLERQSLSSSVQQKPPRYRRIYSAHELVSGTTAADRENRP